MTDINFEDVLLALVRQVSPVESNFEKVILEMLKLPNYDREIFARWMLDELASEQKWTETFASSGDLLEQMAQEALEDEHTLPLDPDTL